LINVDESQSTQKSSSKQISNILNISMKKIYRVKKRFIEEGLAIALCGHPKEREY